MGKEKPKNLPPLCAIFYLPGTLLHRGSIISDNEAEFLGACANEEAQGHRVLDLSDRMSVVGVLTVEAMNALIADAEGVKIDSLPSGRCAVVRNKTDMAEAFIVACPFNDAPAEDTHRLVATDEAQLNWKHHQGAWQARMCLLDGDGKVLGVKWLPPTTKELQGARCHPDSFAKPGDVIEAMKRVNVPMGATEKF